VFADKKLTNISKVAKTPFEFVACLYTLRVTALIGKQFNTLLLKQSGLCPAFYKHSQTSVNSISLNKVLDILEEHDLIEQID